MWRKIKKDKKDRKMMMGGGKGPLGFVFFMAWIGVLFYFEGIAYGFWDSILAILKATVWPAYVIHAVLGLLQIK